MLNTVETAYKLWFTHDGMNKPAVCDLTVMPSRNAVLVLKVRYSDAPNYDVLYALVRFSTSAWLIDLISESSIFLEDPADRESTEYVLKSLDLEDSETEELAAILKLAATQTDYDRLEAVERYSDDPDRLF